MTENKQFKIEFDGNRYFLVIDEVNERCLARLDTMPDARAWLEIYEMLSDENEQLKSTNMEYEDALGRLEEQLKQKQSTIDLLFKQIGAFREDCVVYMDFSGVATLDRLIEILEDSMGIMNGDDND